MENKTYYIIEAENVELSFEDGKCIHVELLNGAKFVEVILPVMPKCSYNENVNKNQL